MDDLIYITFNDIEIWLTKQEIILSIIVIILSFALLFTYIFSKNKKESKHLSEANNKTKLILQYFKNTLICILGFFIGIIILFIFYSYISIPVIPVFTIYIFVSITLKLNCRNNSILNSFLTLLTIISVLIYSFNIYYKINFYPEYGNIVSIILDIINILSFLSAFFMFFNILKKEKQIDC